jgi:hypothetical protein
VKTPETLSRYALGVYPGHRGEQPHHPIGERVLEEVGHRATEWGNQNGARNARDVLVLIFREFETF